jgi:mono/diheme cytochrome c family protein
MILRIVSSSAVVLLLFVGAVWAKPDGATIYADLCASCHAETRLGAQGPALIPESLGRLKGDKLAAVIAEGRPMTQMPAFRDTLTPEAIAAVADYISTPIPTPVWGADEIAASRALRPTTRPPPRRCSPPIR